MHTQNITHIHICADPQNTGSPTRPHCLFMLRKVNLKQETETASPRKTGWASPLCASVSSWEIVSVPPAFEALLLNSTSPDTRGLVAGYGCAVDSGNLTHSHGHIPWSTSASLSSLPNQGAQMLNSCGFEARVLMG